MREVLVESVRWRREDIRHSALKIISFYSHDLPHLGTSRWVNFAARVIPIVLGLKAPNQVQMSGDAFELIFHPPRPTLIPYIVGGMIVWQEREPRLTFIDSTFTNLSPGCRNLIYRVNRAISEEVSGTYKMGVLNDPFSLVFPRGEYGRVNIDKAVLIGER